MPAHNSKTAFKTGIAGTAKTAPMHSSNSPVAQQQINSPVIPNLLSQPRAKPRTTFRERAPPSSSIHEHRPRPPRPTTATLQPTTTRLPHPHQNPVASEGTQRQTTPSRTTEIQWSTSTHSQLHTKEPANGRAATLEASQPSPRPAQPPLSTHRAHTPRTKSPQLPTPPKKCEG